MFIEYGDAYVQPLILSAIQSQPNHSYILLKSPSDLPKATDLFLQITSYENIDFEHLLANPTTSMANSYVIRKALIRKHYLSNTVSAWLAKNPDSPLTYHVKPTLHLELDYAEFLDDALLEAYELKESFARNAERDSGEREWWILKPSMSDRGQGIRLFSTEEELSAIFEQWEVEQSDSDAESEGCSSQPDTTMTPPFDLTAPLLDASKLSAQAGDPNGIITSQLRHFVVQPYIHPPLLFPAHQNRKFHIRSYVLAVGALKVYVFKDMLALFAPEPYIAPGSATDEEPDLRAHLTNTCLQDGTCEGSVVKFWELPTAVPSQPLQPDWKPSVFIQILQTTSALFHAAAQSQSIHFQTLPNAFEIFGVDWMVDADGTAWLLEVNAFPDFAQTGDDLKEVVKGFWEEVIRVAVKRFFDGRGGGEGDEGWDTGEDGMMRKVLDIDMGRG